MTAEMLRLGDGSAGKEQHRWNSKNRPLTVFGQGFKIAGFPHGAKVRAG